MEVFSIFFNPSRIPAVQVLLTSISQVDQMEESKKYRQSHHQTGYNQG